MHLNAGRAPAPAALWWKSMSRRAPSPGKRRDEVDPTLQQALIALRSGRAAEAERLASGVLRSRGASVMATQILGEALLLQGRAQEAVDRLEKPARRSGEPGTETLLAMALDAAGRSAEAMDQLRSATTRRPVFPLAFLKLGEQLGELGRFEEAIAVLEEGLALAPDGVGLRVGLGFLHLRRNDRASARALFLAVLADAPERHDATVGLGRVMVADGEHASAVEQFRRALAMRPGDAATLIELGKCQLEMGARRQGEATLRAAAREAPRLAILSILALSAAPHGRFFLRRSAAFRFLSVEMS